MVSVVIPTIKSRKQLLKRLLKSLPSNVEVLVIDNELMSLAQKRNLGYYLSDGEYILFIDDDNYIKKGAINGLVNSFHSSDIGIVGMLACYDNKRTIICDGGSKRNYQTSFTSGKNTNRVLNQVRNAYEVDEVANAFMIKRKLFSVLGGFDEKNFPIDLDEADLCYRAKKLGYKIIVEPKAVTYHKSQTYSCIPDFRRAKNAYYMGRNRILFQRKHKLPMWFVPLFVLSYTICLLVRGKLNMIYHFLKGVLHGVIGKVENKY